jgi:hypothetical protein
VSFDVPPQEISCATHLRTVSLDVPDIVVKTVAKSSSLANTIAISMKDCGLPKNEYLKTQENVCTKLEYLSFILDVKISGSQTLWMSHFLDVILSHSGILFGRYMKWTINSSKKSFGAFNVTVL